MEKIWAPWRVKYIFNIVKKSGGCVFCRILKEKKDHKNFIFLRTKLSYAVLNIFPYNSGHSLILPKRHVNDISKFTREEWADLVELLEKVKKLLDKTLKPQGYNIGINIGRAAGAGVPRHIHIHIVPRWRGDANFMPVIGHTKVISQSLRSLYRHLIDENKRRYRRN
ncbi:MAG TPA: HIT domain-containing protein [Candidatus Omnitrophota bacterium]|nr:HIT domain-containing protein [Candidatus Omnitrophota bacterium]